MSIRIKKEEKDPVKVNDGVWKRVCRLDGIWHVWESDSFISKVVPIEQTGEVLVRSINNADFKNAVSQSLLSVAKSLTGNQSASLIEKINLDSYSDHLLLAWRGFDSGSENESKESFEDTRENKIFLLQEDPSFFDLIRTIASNSDNFSFDLGDKEELAKNSPSTLDGS